jgi:hypothetical protein
VQLQAELHAPEYAAAQLWPLSRWEDRPLEDVRENFTVEAEVWNRLCATGRFGPTGGTG